MASPPDWDTAERDVVTLDMAAEVMLRRDPADDHFDGVGDDGGAAHVCGIDGLVVRVALR